MNFKPSQKIQDIAAELLQWDEAFIGNTTLYQEKAVGYFMAYHASTDYPLDLTNQEIMDLTDYAIDTAAAIIEAEQERRYGGRYEEGGWW